MSVLWSSFEEFANLVVPQWVKAPYFRLVQRKTAFENSKDLIEAFSDFSECLGRLRELGFTNEGRTPCDESNVDDAFHICADLCAKGEEILLLHKRLATSHWAEDFIAERDLMQDMEGNKVASLTSRDVSKFAEAANGLYQGFQQVLMEDEKFPTNGLSLPRHCYEDFVTARNLFSVGFEEAGFMFAGRGLEGALREFARVKQLTVARGGKTEPANEADFCDLIEILARARWRKDKSPVINKVTRSFLHLVRTTRNTVAHPTQHSGEPTWREMAQVAATRAAAIWEAAQRKRAGLVSKEIIKNWGGI